MATPNVLAVLNPELSAYSLSYHLPHLSFQLPVPLGSTFPSPFPTFLSAPIPLGSNFPFPSLPQLTQSS